MRLTNLLSGLLLLLAVAWSVVALPVAGQTASTGEQIFGRVQPKRAIHVNVAIGLGLNEREYTGDTAQSAAALAATFRFQGYTTEDKIQPFSCTWQQDDAGNWSCVPTKITPLILSVYIAEAWTVPTVDVTYERLTLLSIFDVGEPQYHALYSYGSGTTQLAWHYNKLLIDKADAARWIEQLTAQRSTSADVVIYLSGDLAIVAPGGVFYEFDCPGMTKQYGASQVIDPRQWILIDNGTRIPFLRVVCPETGITTTPQPTLTNTPYGWGTAAPTDTPIPTPTQELKTATPEPTSTPDPGTCVLTSENAINVRVYPNVASQKVDIISTGTIVQPSGYADVNALRWYYVWWPFITPARYVWIADYFSEAGPCDALPVIDPANPPGDLDLTAWGIWRGPGGQDLTQLGNDLKAAGIRPAVTAYADYPALDASWLRVWRVFAGGRDYPDFLAAPARESARAWVDLAVDERGTTGYDYLVVLNEPVFPSAQYAHDWIASAIERAAERGVPGLVPVVFASGHPELADVPLIMAAYADAPIPVVIGYNVYPIDTSLGLCAWTNYTQWTTYRWTMYVRYLPAGVRLGFTEIAGWDGNTPFSEAEFACFVRNAGRYSEAVAFGTAWYDAVLGQWAGARITDLHALARAIGADVTK